MFCALCVWETYDIYFWDFTFMKAFAKLIPAILTQIENIRVNIIKSNAVKLYVFKIFNCQGSSNYSMDSNKKVDEKNRWTRSLTIGHWLIK